MKSTWLNVILHLSNRIYQRKQLLVKQEGMTIVGNAASLIVLEIALAIVSLPLYIGIKPQKVTVFLQEKGGYAKIAYDYKVRRIFTLTGLGIFLLIWTLK